MAESFIRLFRIVQLVPRAPRAIDTVTLEAILVREGFTNARRTLQRDLVKLERMNLGLECLSDSKPYRWRFLEAAHLPAALHAEGGTGDGERVDVIVRVDPTARAALIRAPLAPGQLVTHKGGELVVEARAPDTPALRRHLVALGPLVEVVAPVSLRESIAETHRAAAARYASDVDAKRTDRRLRGG